MNDTLKVKNFIQSVIDNPKPLDEQWCERRQGFVWCSDWEIIEIAKCLMHGPEVYRLDPPPNRLKGNPLWSMEKIVAEAKFLTNRYKNIDDVINKLKEERQRGDTPTP